MSRGELGGRVGDEDKINADPQELVEIAKTNNS